jgi:four helix bundle protein
MARIESHRDLIVWQRGMELVELVYAFTRDFPADERFRLVNQATRAAVAIPANLAEGHARGTRREYAQFVAIARGSLMELETYVMIAQRLGYGSELQLTDSLERITELSRMLTALRNRLIEPRTEPPCHQ